MPEAASMEIFNNYDYKWAKSWENLFLPYANNKGADQPAHPRSLISAFVVRYLDSIICILATSKISRLASFCSWAAGFESYLVANPKTGFLVTWLKFRKIIFAKKRSIKKARNNQCMCEKATWKPGLYNCKSRTTKAWGMGLNLC